MSARAATVILGLAAVALATSPGLRAGSLEPPGPPASTMKTLDQVEPRRPVQSLPGNAQYMHVISEPGSYYLTSDIVAPMGKRGIAITAGGPVTLDLSGFSLTGNRDGMGLGGIIVFFGSTQPLVVRNGSLRDWDGAAVSALETGEATFENLQIFNSLIGINAGAKSVVRRCLIDTTAYAIYAETGGTIVDSVVNSTGVGIQVAGAGRIESCTIRNANTTGILVASDTVVRGNTLTGGNAIEISGVTGIGKHNTIEGNTCIATGPCVSTPHPASTGNLVIRNSAIGSPTADDFPIAPGNFVGPVTSDPTTAGPWANISGD